MNAELVMQHADDICILHCAFPGCWGFNGPIPLPLWMSDMQFCRGVYHAFIASVNLRTRSGVT
jgi:hypothetical protein